MKGAKLLIVGALLATPAVVVLAVQKAEPLRAAATDARRSRWEYRVMHERELAVVDESSTALASYSEEAAADVPRKKEAKLNEMGTQGWALVAAEGQCLIFRRSRD